MGTLTYRGTYGQYFSRSCLTAHGDNPSCADFDAALNAFFQSSSGISGIACADAAEGGCECSYEFAAAAAFNGTWAASDGVVTHFDAFGKLPSRADYCVSGTVLELRGHERTFLWDQAGVRGVVFAQ
jgi:hypothetical protein